MRYFRLFIIIALAILIICGFAWLAMQTGEIIYSNSGVKISINPAIAAAGLLLSSIIISVLWAIIGWFIALPNRLKKANQENNRKKAIEYIGIAIAAFENGDFSESKRNSQKAFSLLSDSPTTKLLAAFHALAADDTIMAEKLLGELSQVAGFEVVARKGLAQIASKSGNYSAAIAHANTALQVSKKAIWPLELMLKERINNADWEGAISTLDDIEKRGLIGKKTALRKRAVILSAAAHRAERNNDSIKALDYANRAAKLASSFAPAAVMAARLQSKAGKDWAAASIIEHAWEKEPHPALSLAYKDLKSTEDKGKISKWAEALIKLRPEHRESKILQTESAIAKNDTKTANSILETLIAERETSRLLALKAQVAQINGENKMHDDLMQQAAVSPREPDWSDLDPSGVAFQYEDEDWARLVETYGDNGQLIHPRLERLQPSKQIKDTNAETINKNTPEINNIYADNMHILQDINDGDNAKPKRNWFSN